MAQKPFDRVVINPLEKPRSEDFNNLQAQLDRTLRDYLAFLYGARTGLSDATLAVRSGFIGDGFKVVPGGGMTVNLTQGMGFFDQPGDNVPAIDGVVGVDDLSRYKPLSLTLPQPLIVPPAPIAPNSRVDLIEVRYDRRRENSLQREKLNTVTGAYDPFAFLKTLAFNLDGRVGVVNAPANSTAAIGYKVGVAGNPGTLPTVSPNYMAVGAVVVPNGAVAVAGNMCWDLRTLLFHGGLARLLVGVAMTKGGPSTNTYFLHSDPGIEATSTPGTVGANGDAFLFIKAGDGSMKCRASTACEPGNSTIIAQGRVTGPTTVTVDGALQTALAGATPPMNAALGQVLHKVFLTASAAVDGGGGAINTANLPATIDYVVHVSLANG